MPAFFMAGLLMRPPVIIAVLTPVTVMRSRVLSMLRFPVLAIMVTPVMPVMVAIILVLVSIPVVRVEMAAAMGVMVVSLHTGVRGEFTPGLGDRCKSERDTRQQQGGKNG